MSFARSASQNLRGDWPGTSNSSRLASDWPSLRTLRALAPATRSAIAEAENLIAATRGVGFRWMGGAERDGGGPRVVTFFVEKSACGRSVDGGDDAERKRCLAEESTMMMAIEVPQRLRQQARRRPRALRGSSLVGLHLPAPTTCNASWGKAHAPRQRGEWRTLSSSQGLPRAMCRTGQPLSVMLSSERRARCSPPGPYPAGQS